MMKAQTTAMSANAESLTDSEVAARMLAGETVRFEILMRRCNRIVTVVLERISG